MKKLLIVLMLMLPLTVTWSANDDQITATWDAVQFADSYNVYNGECRK